MIRKTRFSRVELAVIILLIAAAAYFAGHIFTDTAVRQFPPGRCSPGPSGTTICIGE